MKTNHRILFQNSNNMHQIKNNSINLMITSPPYPMIRMWDEMFSKQNPKIKEALKNNDGSLAFELMNQELDEVWNEVYRVLKEGGIACIDIGDATRTIDSNFQLFSNSSRIISYCMKIGFSCLPKIIWKKTTNSPNKFMGSGMLPPSAYVTLEHEYIIILRKGKKREFKTSKERENRQESSYFWEERNLWFSDIWEGLNGVLQKLEDKNIRERSAAYPFELAYRLINMFSVKDDVVLDPYFGTGTTMLAAMNSGRNSIGIEIDHFFENTIKNRTKKIIEHSNKYIENRINKHLEFVENREAKKGALKYINKNHGFKVMTRQELSILINPLSSIKNISLNEFEVGYLEEATKEKFSQNSKSGIISNNRNITDLIETQVENKNSVLTSLF